MREQPKIKIKAEVACTRVTIKANPIIEPITHFLDRIERSCIPNTEVSCHCRCGLSMLGVRAVDAEHVSIANTTPGLQMKSRYEAAADNPIPSLFANRHPLDLEVNTSEF